MSLSALRFRSSNLPLISSQSSGPNTFLRSSTGGIGSLPFYEGVENRFEADEESDQLIERGRCAQAALVPGKRQVEGVVEIADQFEVGGMRSTRSRLRSSTSCGRSELTGIS